MKLKQWLCGATALAMLAACSDKDVAPDSSGGDSKGSGFISIAIGMPSGVGSRANDVFDDGLESEYKVNSIAILFFSGREESATFLKAYDVNKEFGEENPKGDQITSSNKVTFPVDVTETSESLWALAIVNYKSVFTIDGVKHTLTVVDTNSEFSGTIKDFLALTTKNDLSFSSQANFFMTNTPYTTAPGSGVTSAPTGLIHLLAPVDKEKIADTELKAKQNPAAEIFVERAVAKVEVIDAIDNKIEDIEKIEWVIDNTEPSTYVVRNLVYRSFDATEAPKWMAYTQTSDFLNDLRTAQIAVPTQNYRFVGNNPFDAVNLNYRLYFGVDPNGNGIDAGELNVLKDDAITANTFKAIGEGNPQYCYENTFDVKHQDYMNTTRVILKVTFGGGSFFTRGIDRNTRYRPEDAQMTLAHFVIDNVDVVNTWTNHFSVPTTITIESLDCIFDSENGTGSASNEWIELGYGVDNGRLKVTSIKLLDGNAAAPAEVKFPDTVDVNDVMASVNSQVTFNAYIGGVSYYAIRIKHFGDDLTPWLEPDGETSTTAQSYPGLDANNYLGRYGVLRNNWYQLNISNIEKYGEPTVGDLVLDTTPDDKVDPEKSISCKINILSWARRYQSVDF